MEVQRIISLSEVDLQQMSQEETDTKVLLNNLGFESWEIVEAIVSTENKAGVLNAAPMGIVRTGRKTLQIRPFLDTTTFRNISETGKATINVTHDIALYLETAFDGSTPLYQLVKRASSNAAAMLRRADAYIFASVVEQGQCSEDRSYFVCEVQGVRINNRFPRVHSRGFAASLEAIIHATRIRAFIRYGQRQKVEELLQSFEQCRQTVAKVSEKGSTNAEVIRILRDMIDEWLRQLK